MSESVEGPQASDAPKAKKSFVARVIGVFMSPSETFEDIARKPTILAPLLLIFLVQGAVTYIQAPAAGEDAATFTESSSFLQRLPVEQREQIIEQQLNPSTGRRVGSAVAAPVVVFVLLVISTLIFWGIGNLLGGEPTFKKTLSMLLFAGLIGIVAGQLLKLPLIISKNSVAGVTFSPALLMPDLAFTSSKYRLLAIFDLFALWGTVVIGIGFAKISKISTAAGMVTSFVFFAAVSTFFYILTGLFS